MLASDYIVDIGEGAGINGGNIIAEGTPKQILKNTKSITGNYLSGRNKIPTPTDRRTNKKNEYLELKGASTNNLKNIDLKIPLGTFVCVTGVSGSGKSSLIIDTLLPIIEKEINNKKHLQKEIIFN